MSCLIVVGSQREGNSLRIGEKVKKLLESKKEDVSLIIPGKQDIKLCTGCLKCDETHECIFKDDMAENLELFDKSDYIVLITPTRFNLLSSDMKVFMDRLCPLCMTCDFKKKKVIAISIGQTAAEEESVDNALKCLVEFTNNCGMEMIFQYKFYDCYGSEDLDDNKIEKMCQELGKLWK